MTKLINSKSSKIEKSNSSRASQDIVDEDYSTPTEVDVNPHDNELNYTDDQESELTKAEGSKSSKKITAKVSDNFGSIKEEVLDGAKTSTARQSSLGKAYIMPIDVDEHSNNSVQAPSDVRLSYLTKSQSSRSSKKVKVDNNINDNVEDKNRAEISTKVNYDEDEYKKQQENPATDDQDFGSLVKSTFVIAYLHPVVDRKYLDTAGISVLKPVLNIEIVNGLCEKTIVSVWGPNANNVSDHIE